MGAKNKITAVQGADNVCVDIEGFNFNNYDASDIAAIREFWLQYGVIRFRNANISDQQQLEFSIYFGEFVIHPKQLQEGGHPTHPEILVISNEMKNGRPSGAMGNSEATWHTDTWFYEKPPAGAILRAVKVPETGGDTYFLSTYRAYDTLPNHLREAVNERQIFFQSAYDKTGKLRLGRTKPTSEDFREWVGMVHPLVRTHGETGREALYLGGTADGAWIVGMPLDESSDLLSQLWKHTTTTDEVFVQKWNAGDIMMWAIAAPCIGATPSIRVQSGLCTAPPPPANGQSSSLTKRNLQMPTPYRTASPPKPLEQELLALLADVETATIGHFESSGFITAGVRPVFPARAIGRAITVAALGRDGRIVYMAIDMLEPGDVLVISRLDQDDLACVGGGVAAAAKAKGAAAIIVDGPCTDPAEIVNNGLPVWCRGVSAKTTSRHTLLGGEINFPIACGNAVVMPGYCVLADDSGIYVAEPTRMREIAAQARIRQLRSLAVRQHLLAGRSIFDFDRENSQ